MPARPQRSLLISPIAEKDLAEIWSCIASDSPQAATEFIAQFRDRFAPLLRQPEIGSRREQLAPGLRAVVHKRYVIYYVFDAEAVTIVRILHSARDSRALF